MNESTPRKTSQSSRSRLVPYVIAAVCVVAVLLAVFLWKPVSADPQSQASADANGSTADQRLDPFMLSSYLASDIDQFTYGRVEGQDYQVEPSDGTNKYIFASSIGYLSIADEQDHMNIYTDSATNIINKVEYQAVVPQNEKSAFIDAFSLKMTDMETVFGNTYETLYHKDAQTQTADTGYTYQMIYDALQAGQPGIYTINWSQGGFLISLQVDSASDPENYALAVSFWNYANAVGSATP